MPSPICTVNGSSTSGGVNVGLSSFVTIQLADLTGVNSWAISCIGTDELQSASTITNSLSVNPTTKTATFTAPSEVTGCKLVFQSQVNRGTDLNGITQSSYTTTFAVCTLGALNLRVLAVNETLESDPLFGWVKDYNTAQRSMAGNAVSASGFISHITSVSNTYTASNTDELIKTNSTAGTFSVFLPSVPTDKKKIVVKDSAGTAFANPVIINGNGKSIDGSSTYVLSINYASVGLAFDGVSNTWSVL